jgi:hypothetical protein
MDICEVLDACDAMDQLADIEAHARINLIRPER